MKKVATFMVLLSLTSLVLFGCSTGKEKKAEKTSQTTTIKAEIGEVKAPTEEEMTALSLKEGDAVQTTNGLAFKITGIHAITQDKQEYLTVDFEITNQSEATLAVGAGDFDVYQGKKKQTLFGLTENIGSEIEAGATLKGSGSYTWEKGETTGTIEYNPLNAPFEKLDKQLLWHIN